MSTPTPDALRGLRDIHLPEPGPDVWLTTGGALLLLGILLLAGWLLVPRLCQLLAAALRAHRRQRARRTALAALHAIRSRARHGTSLVEVTSELSVLLRRVALSRYPRARVAGLCGPRWLDFLDTHLPQDAATGRSTAFAGDAGRLLIRAPYAPEDEQLDAPRPASCAPQLGELFELCETWIRHNAGPVQSPTDEHGGAPESARAGHLDDPHSKQPFIAWAGMAPVPQPGPRPKRRGRLA
ncbi:MAG: DUF4381 domain-containing protein [Gammaproteobacteria bacterium]|nr:DUF4381 domain-containing protein [Gammaproteobacteria bacterium]